MASDTPPTLHREDEIKDLVSGLKVFVAVVLIITAFLATRIIFKLDQFEQIFTDMLGDKPLPKLTQIVFHFSGFIQAVSVLIPTLGLVSLFVSKSVKQALAAASISLALTFILSVICNTAAFTPMIQIITEMNSIL